MANNKTVREMNVYIPILSAFVGAAFGSLLGAYFTFVSKKRERIWIEKYEAFREITEIIGLIKEAYDIEHSRSMGVKKVPEEERQSLIAAIGKSKNRLREQSAALQLLLNPKDLDKFLEYRFALDISFQNLIYVQPQENLTDFIEEVYEAAGNVQKETFRMANKECL
jgi:hypothetical protein